MNKPIPFPPRVSGPVVRANDIVLGPLRVCTKHGTVHQGACPRCPA